LSLLVAAPSALAALPADTPLLDLPLEDLLQVAIRSAGKRWEQVRDIPASVTIVTRDDIARYGYVTFEELLKNIPGFFVLDNTEERFVGNRGTVGGGIQLLVNGVPQHPSRQKGLTVPEVARLNIPVQSIDRIEVIRGPMSVIYGNNAFLGVINVVTSAIEQNGPEVSASAGSEGTGRLFARAGATSPEGYVALNAGGHRTDGLGGAYADMMDEGQLATLKPGMHASMDGHMDRRDLSLDLSAGWEGWTADLRYSELDYGFYAFTPGFDEGNRLRLTTWHAALGWQHTITDDLGLVASAVHSEERYDAYELDFLDEALDGDQRQHSRRTDLELNLHYTALPTVSLLTGYRFRVLDGVENRVSVPLVPEGSVSLDGVRLHDLFAEAGWDVTDRLRVVGGARLARLPDGYQSTTVDRLEGTRLVQEVAVDDRNLVTGRVAALWSLDDHQVVKLIWGTAAQDSDQIQFSDPERIETVELSYVRATPGWTLSAGLFRNRTSNIVRTIQQIDPVTREYESVDDNSGEWLTNGLELIGEVRPLPSLSLGFSATWQDTEDRETGIDPGYSPALLVKLKADYRRAPFTYAVYSHHVSGMEPDWDFVDSPTPGVTERIGERVDGYWNVGVSLRYEHPRSGLYAHLNVSNLLDTEIRYPANELADLARGLIGPGRVVTATVGWKF
jgi:outer membrane receptor protein involved in Fe transport